MMGLSLAMVSGQVASELLDDVPAGIPNLELLSPDRYTRAAL